VLHGRGHLGLSWLKTTVPRGDKNKKKKEFVTKGGGGNSIVTYRGRGGGLKGKKKTVGTINYDCGKTDVFSAESYVGVVMINVLSGIKVTFPGGEGGYAKKVGVVHKKGKKVHPGGGGESFIQHGGEFPQPQDDASP